MKISRWENSADLNCNILFMQKVLVSVYSWENPILFESDLELEKDDKVIVASEFANELGIVFQTGMETVEEPKGKILRKATKRDKEVFEEYEKQRADILKIGREETKKLHLFSERTAGQHLAPGPGQRYNNKCIAIKTAAKNARRQPGLHFGTGYSGPSHRGK